MKKSSRRRPEVESLESLRLLSTLTLSASPTGSNSVPTASLVQEIGSRQVGIIAEPGTSVRMTTTSRPVVVAIAGSPTIASQSPAATWWPPS